MKNIQLLGIAVAITMAQTTFASREWDTPRRPMELTKVTWKGTFQCDEKQHGADHQKDHACDLEFVNDSTGQVWNVKSSPEIASMHQNAGKPVKVRIEAQSSPRFLLGGSYVKIDKIEPLAE